MRQKDRVQKEEAEEMTDKYFRMENIKPTNDEWIEVFLKQLILIDDRDYEQCRWKW